MPPDVLQAMVRTAAQALVSAEADAMCGAGYGQRSDERVNSRDGYRVRDRDARAGRIDPAIPKLRSGSYFPACMLAPRRRAEQAMVSVVATSYRSASRRVGRRSWSNSSGTGLSMWSRVMAALMRERWLKAWG